MNNFSSRLSPKFEHVIADPLLLFYFIDYLKLVDSENMFRFWLELSGCLDRSSLETGNDIKYEIDDVFVSVQQLDILRERISQLPVTNATSIYFRYLSKEAKLPTNLPIELLCCALKALLENPHSLYCFMSCLRFSESIIRDDLFPHFLQNPTFTKFRLEIVKNKQLNLDDILFEDYLLVDFVEFLGSEPSTILLTFLLAVNAYKNEFRELIAKCGSASESLTEHYKYLLDDATTICAKYLSPASEDFMGLSLEQYRGDLDRACSEECPKLDCFDNLYEIIHSTVEKKILPSFFNSSQYARFQLMFIEKHGTCVKRFHDPSIKPPSERKISSSLELNVAALSDMASNLRLPNTTSKKATSLNFIWKKLTP